MLKNGKIAAALVTGALAAGLLGSAPAIAMADDPAAEVQSAEQNEAQSAEQSAEQNEAQTAEQSAEQNEAQSAEQNESQGQLAHRYVHGKVVAHSGVRIRARATTYSQVLGGYHGGAIIKLSCKVKGQWVDGNKIWYKLADRKGYVTARYVKNLKPVNYCR
ncbi:SH3 domain-containing protein [Streptomyces sparsus]